MNPPADSARSPRPVSISGGVGLLALSLALVLVPAGLAALRFGGTLELLAMLAAASVCLAAGVVPLLLVPVCRGPQAAYHVVLLGMLARMALSLLFVLVITQWESPLAETAVVYDLLLFYLVALAAETGWMIRHVVPTKGL